MFQNLILATSKYVKRGECGQMNKKRKRMDIKRMNNKPSPVSHLLFHFLHQPCSIRLCNKKIKADICSATNLTGLPRKLKIPPTTLPTIAAFLISLLIAFASFVNHFFKALSSFGRGNPEAAGLTPLPKTHVIASAIVQMIIERDESIDTILILCSRNRI